MMCMSTTSSLSARSIEVTGLPEETIRSVEEWVSVLRRQAKTETRYASYEDWSVAFRAWIDSHAKNKTEADWSRESIYAGRGQ